MKSPQNTQNLLKEKQIIFRTAIETSIELKDGTKTKIVSVFNNSEIHFEEIVIGINTGLKLIANIKSSKSVCSYFENNTLKPFATYETKTY